MGESNATPALFKKQWRFLHSGIIQFSNRYVPLYLIIYLAFADLLCSDRHEVHYWFEHKFLRQGKYINVNNLKRNKIQCYVSSIAEKDMTSSGSGYERHLQYL